MSIQRCPECGIRLRTNYCDVCMKRVPFRGAPEKQTFQKSGGSSAHRMERGHECVSFDEDRKMPWGGSSAHRTEKGHKCITFEKKEKKSFSIPVPKKPAADKKKATSVLAIVLAVLSLLPALFGIVEDMSLSEPAPQPEPLPGQYEGFVPAIEPGEIYSDGGVSVFVDCVALYYDDYTVFMTVVNESDEDIIVGTDLLSVNGFMHGSSFYAEVDAGETVQESLQTYSWEMERDGIKEVAEIAFFLNIYPDDFSDMKQSELITLKTDAAPIYEQPAFPDGWGLYISDDIKMNLVNCADNYGDYELDFYLENLSESVISISTPVIRINGVEADGYLWTTLRPDTRSNCEVYLYADGVDTLEQIEEISMDLLIEYMDGFEILESRTETITFNPNEF